jgi:hypothetical protein
LNRAVELDLSSDGAIVSRSDTYRQMHRFDEAVADLNRAIGLDPSTSWVITHRGVTTEKWAGSMRRWPT